MQVERQETTFCTPDSWAECRTLSLMWMFVLWERIFIRIVGLGAPRFHHQQFINNSKNHWSSDLALGAEQATPLCAHIPIQGVQHPQVSRQCQFRGCLPKNPGWSGCF